MPNFDWVSKKCDADSCHQDHMFLTDKDTGQIYASIHGPDEFGHFAMYPNDDEGGQPKKYTTSDQALGAAMVYAELVNEPKPDFQAVLMAKLDSYLASVRPPDKS